MKVASFPKSCSAIIHVASSSFSSFGSWYQMYLIFNSVLSINLKSTHQSQALLIQMAGMQVQYLLNAG